MCFVQISLHVHVQLGQIIVQSYLQTLTLTSVQTILKLGVVAMPKPAGGRIRVMASSVISCVCWRFKEERPVWFQKSDRSLSK